MHGTYKSVLPTTCLPRQATRRMRWTAWLALCLARRRERRALQGLSDDRLKDIGLSRADLERECRRWLWDGRARDE